MDVSIGTEEAAQRAMTYLDRDPIVKALKEKDLYVQEGYLGKGGIRSWQLVRISYLSCATAGVIDTRHRWRRRKSSSMVS